MGSPEPHLAPSRAATTHGVISALSLHPGQDHGGKQALSWSHGTCIGYQAGHGYTAGPNGKPGPEQRCCVSVAWLLCRDQDLPLIYLPGAVGGPVNHSHTVIFSVAPLLLETQR